jgi:hypothetical protein
MMMEQSKEEAKMKTLTASMLAACLAASAFGAEASPALKQLQAASGSKTEQAAQDLPRFKASAVSYDALKQAAPDRFLDARTEAKAAIAKALETFEADKVSKITKLDVSPTPLGTVYTFQAKLRVTGLAGPNFAQEYKITGAYDVLSRKVSVAGRERIQSAK